MGERKGAKGEDMGVVGISTGGRGRGHGKLGTSRDWRRAEEELTEWEGGADGKTRHRRGREGQRKREEEGETRRGKGGGDLEEEDPSEVLELLATVDGNHGSGSHVCGGPLDWGVDGGPFCPPLGPRVVGIDVREDAAPPEERGDVPVVPGPGTLLLLPLPHLD